MRIRIGSRQSDLARIQAFAVADKILRQEPRAAIEFAFRESFGDLNLDVPLTDVGRKGVFTEDFHQGLVSGELDLVVHSWKDLPTEARPETEIVATLKRADPHDVLLIKKSSWPLDRGAELNIMTSSPRRGYHLEKNLARLLPLSPKLRFSEVRGNIPTRIAKFLDAHSHAQGLVVAKAALDRLLGEVPRSARLQDPSWVAEFLNRQNRLREQLKGCLWMCLPLELFPPAPAQGALAIEVKRGSSFRELMATLNSGEDFEDVLEERAILSAYGGGCHQKIGAHVRRASGLRVVFKSGKTEAGSEFFSREIRDVANYPPPKNRMGLWSGSSVKMFRREKLPTPEGLDSVNLFVARKEAWPQGYLPHGEQVVWVSGVKTWAKLAQEGVWVNGGNDSLGGGVLCDLGIFSQKPWLRLTHEGSAGRENRGIYRLWPEDISKSEFLGKTHFFWSSGSQFLRACEIDPGILNAYHATGLGKTREVVLERVPQGRVRTFLSHEDWLKWAEGTL